MDSKKICPNQTCRTENPHNAQYCRTCGTPIQDHIVEDFTLNVFKDYKLTPVSVKKMPFVKKSSLVLLVLCVMSLIFLESNLGVSFAWEIADAIDVYYRNIIDLCEGICVLLIVLQLFLVLKSTLRWLNYSYEADFIEDLHTSNIRKDIVRIAKQSKMGLFDLSRKKVLLPSKYDNIEKFDDDNVIISIANVKGLYSLKYQKLIIPVQCDKINPFVNYVSSVMIHGQEFHYDVKGNKLR